MNSTPTMMYFGRHTVEKFVAAYFGKHGLTEEVRDDLIYIVERKPAEFLEIVCDYVEKENA